MKKDGAVGGGREDMGMCFQTRIADLCFWPEKAGQVGPQMEEADPISFWELKGQPSGGSLDVPILFQQ